MGCGEHTRGMGKPAIEKLHFGGFRGEGATGFKMEFIPKSKIIDFLPSCIPYMV